MSNIALVHDSTARNILSMKTGQTEFFYSDILMVLNINNKKSWYFQIVSSYRLCVMLNNICTSHTFKIYDICNAFLPIVCGKKNYFKNKIVFCPIKLVYCYLNIGILLWPRVP